MSAPPRGAERNPGGRPPASEKLVASNRKAFHDYEILDRLEAGLVLAGTEVKSLREGRANLKEAWIVVENGEAFLLGCHISSYEAGSYNNHEPERRRKLLLHARQIGHLAVKIQEKGLTVVPLRIYFKGSRAKIELAVAKGRKLHDKRDALREREMSRETQAALKASRRK
jgi:SsrA-binding protein